MHVVSEGDGPLGWVVDWALLNLPAVKATRNRKDAILKILKNEIANNQLSGKKTYVIDVGAGTSRYLLDLAREYSAGSVEALSIDYDRESLNLGKKIAEAVGAQKPGIRRR